MKSFQSQSQWYHASFKNKSSKLGRVCPQCRRPGFDPWVGKIPCRRKWQPTPVFLPGEVHGWAWWATVHGVTKSWTRLSDWLSLQVNSFTSSSQISIFSVCCVPPKPLGTHVRRLHKSSNLILNFLFSLFYALQLSFSPSQSGPWRMLTDQMNSVSRLTGFSPISLYLDYPPQ